MLKEKQLPALFSVRGIDAAELRPELQALMQQLQLVERTQILLAGEGDFAAPPLSPPAVSVTSPPQSPKGRGGDSSGGQTFATLLGGFHKSRHAKLAALQDTVGAAEAATKALAAWLAEPPSSATVEQLLSPIANFITAIERAQADSLLAAARSQRRVRTAGGVRQSEPDVATPSVLQRSNSVSSCSPALSMLVPRERSEGACTDVRERASTLHDRALRRRAASARDVGNSAAVHRHSGADRNSHGSSSNVEAFDELRREMARRSSLRAGGAQNGAEPRPPLLNPPPAPAMETTPPLPRARRALSETYSSITNEGGGGLSVVTPTEAALEKAGPHSSSRSGASAGSGKMMRQLRWLVTQERRDDEEEEEGEEEEEAKVGMSATKAPAEPPRPVGSKHLRRYLAM